MAQSIGYVVGGVGSGVIWMHKLRRTGANRDSLKYAGDQDIDDIWHIIDMAVAWRRLHVYDWCGPFPIHSNLRAEENERRFRENSTENKAGVTQEKEFDC